MESVNNNLNSSNLKFQCDINEIYYDPKEENFEENKNRNVNNIFYSETPQKSKLKIEYSNRKKYRK